MIVVVDDMITIGDSSSRCGLSPKVLRTSAEAGVLVPALVDPTSGYRNYQLSPGDERLLPPATQHESRRHGRRAAPPADSCLGAASAVG